MPPFTVTGGSGRPSDRPGAWNAPVVHAIAVVPATRRAAASHAHRPVRVADGRCAVPTTR